MPEKTYEENKIIIEYLTDDADERELCRMYWERDESGYKHKALDVAAKFGYKRGQLQHILPKLCVVYHDGSQCRRCGDPQSILRSRSSGGWGWVTDGYCDPCKEINAAEAEQERKETKNKLMADAFDGGVYESLTDLEFNFLVELADNGVGLAPVSKSLGISESHGVVMLRKLDKIHLVDWSDDGYRFLPYVQEALSKKAKRIRVKAIFGSPQAARLYRILKREHLFVFPEIPVCAIVERDQVSHLFTEEWHSFYFLTARLDFVVCDKAGIPEFALEYQGGYHQNAKQAERDAFKLRMINEIGLSLRWIDAATLNSLDNGSESI